MQPMTDSVLVTGGTGFIGSHACVALARAGYDVTVVDNLSNSRRSVLERVSRIVGRPVGFAEGDIRDAEFLRSLFATRRHAAVVHFAGLKAVGESVAEPLRYWDNNVGGTLALLRAMEAAEVRRIVFSSSATVYGDGAAMPLS